jgi:cellulose synthase operon protein C
MGAVVNGQLKSLDRHRLCAGNFSIQQCENPIAWKGREGAVATEEFCHGRKTGMRLFVGRELRKAGFLFAVCLGAWIPGPAQGPHPQVCTGPTSLEAPPRARRDAEAYAALGMWFDQNHQPQCALDSFRSGLKIAPDSAHLYFLLGQSLFSAGRVQESMAPLEQAVRLNPDAMPAHLLLGTVLTRLGRNQEAADQWKAALKIDPGSKAALDGLARRLTALGDYDRAIRLLSSAARDETLTLDLAIAYRKAGMYDEAAKVLSDGVESMPDSDALTAALVSLDVDESHFEAASVLAEKIAERKPDDLEAQRIYLRTLVVTGNNQVAAPLGHKLLALAPHDADLLNLNGLLEQKAGDFESARKHLEEAVALSPNDYNPRVNLGVVLADLKDPAGARKQLEKAIALGTDEPQVHFELAKVLRTLGEMQAAQEQLAIYQKRLKEESDQAEAVSKATEAAEAIKAGDDRKAADLYRQACAAQPENAPLEYRLAMVLDSLGDADGERAALAQAIKANPRLAQAQYQLGYMDFQAGNNASAEREFRATVEALPDNVQAWISLAATLGAESRVEEARAAIGHALRLQPENPAARALSEKLSDAQQNRSHSH